MLAPETQHEWRNDKLNPRMALLAQTGSGKATTWRDKMDEVFKGIPQL